MNEKEVETIQEDIAYRVENTPIPMTEQPVFGENGESTGTMEVQDASLWGDYIDALEIDTLGEMLEARYYADETDAVKAQMIQNGINAKRDAIATQVAESLRAERIPISEAIIVLDAVRAEFMNTILA